MSQPSFLQSTDSNIFSDSARIGNSETTPMSSANPTPVGSPSLRFSSVTREPISTAPRLFTTTEQQIQQRQQQQLLDQLPLPPTSFPTVDKPEDLPPSILKTIIDSSQHLANSESVIESLFTQRDKFQTYLTDDEIPSFIQTLFPKKNLNIPIEQYSINYLNEHIEQINGKIAAKIEAKNLIFPNLERTVITDSNRIFRMNTDDRTREINPFLTVYRNNRTFLWLFFQYQYQRYRERNIASAIKKEKEKADKASKFELAKQQKAAKHDLEIRKLYNLNENFTMEEKMEAMEKKLSMLLGKGSGPSKSKKGHQKQKGNVSSSKKAKNNLSLKKKQKPKTNNNNKASSSKTNSKDKKRKKTKEAESSTKKRKRNQAENN